MASAAPLRIWRPFRLTPLIRVWAVNGTNVAPSRVDVPLPDPVLLLGEDDDAAALRCLVGQRRELGGVGQVALGDSGGGEKAVACRFPRVMVPVLSSRRTSTSPAASTARPDMAITFAWIIRSMPAIPMADSSPPMVVGMRQTRRATSTVTVTGVPWPARVHAVERVRQQGGGGEQEDDGEPRQQDVQRDLVRRLLALGALDHGDHAVEEGFAGIRA